ncbi:hypothetical protein Y5W_00664 [Alcanivorax sp. 521-1]|uniref:SAF domain-containing protein n=1 Tax=Alloalcanivorax profundimaris TaxID=2735259 RepID=A0ABS0AMM3_9GAMM|nr:hypothetical protein [Alloalcanivorax profundimaris]
MYTLPAMLLALLALILALVGLSREPEPASVERAAPVSAPSASPAEDEPAYEYWVVRQRVEAGQTLDAEQLAVVSADTPITGALSADEAIAGKQVQSTVRAGELLAARHLEAGGSLPANLPVGHRAIAIPVDNVTVAGGLLRPGDRVDVITAFRRSDKDAPVALVMLKRIQVLALRGLMSDSDTSDENNRRNDTVVLSVPEEKVSALMLASSEGKLRLAVVGGNEKSPLPGSVPEPVTPDGQDKAPMVAVNEAADDTEPFYFEDFFPEPPKAAAPARRASPGRRVQVFEGAESRSTYVR